MAGGVAVVVVEDGDCRAKCNMITHSTPQIIPYDRV